MGLDPRSGLFYTQRQTDGGAYAGNQVSRLRRSVVTADGALRLTWGYNMQLSWLVLPTIRQNKPKSCRPSATAWWRWLSSTEKEQGRFLLRRGN
jgi:hypothetical protein